MREPVPAGATVSATDSCNVGAIDPNELVTVTFSIKNIGTTNIGTLKATLLATGGVTSPSGQVTVGSLNAGVTKTAAFTFTAGNLACGATLVATLALLDNTTSLGTISYDLLVGKLLTVPFSSGNLNELPIPDKDSIGVEIPINVPDVGALAGVKASFRIDHTWDSDLLIDLVHPDGTVVSLVAGAGDAGDNFGTGANDCTGTPTLIDDAASTAIAAGVAPFTGAFQPEDALAAFTGKPSEGTWKLRIIDTNTGLGDVGTVGCFKLELQKVACCGAEIHAFAPVIVTAENAVPPNGVPDPSETLTASFPLLNLGGSNTTNLVATLQATGGVTSPSAAQTYGALAAGGPAVARSFTFTAAGACGSTITPTFALQDGATNLGTISFPLRLGGIQVSTQTFANATPILIPADQGPDPGNGVAAPYPSTITVTGMTGTIGAVTVNLNGFNHAFPSDVDMMLVSPTGQQMIVMSGAGDGIAAVNADLILDDTAATAMPDAIGSGTFRPTSLNSFVLFDPPAPSGPYLNPAPAGTDTLTSAFAGQNPNGDWRLYALDALPSDVGHITDGWGVSITSETSSCSVLPTVPNAPTAVTATAGIAQASVSFTPPANDGGSAITGYTATCTPTAGPPVAASGPASPVVVAGLTNGVTYTCTVHATNGVGNGPESSASNPVTPFAIGFALTAAVAGSGTGTVASNVPGIACPGDCAQTYGVGTPVVLTATATAGHVFTGWLGACTGTSATCNVTVNTATAVSATFAAPGTPTNLDIDLSAPGTRYDALTDGLLIVRHLFGLSGTALTSAAVGATATRTPAAIGIYLTDIKPLLDVDGNGQADAFTDGLLIMRSMFGLTGTALTSGATGTGATRTTPAQIQSYLSGLTP